VGATYTADLKSEPFHAAKSTEEALKKAVTFSFNWAMNEFDDKLSQLG